MSAEHVKIENCSKNYGLVAGQRRSEVSRELPCPFLKGKATLKITKNTGNGGSLTVSCSSMCEKRKVPGSY